MRIPEGVREVIGRRLDRLSERCNQVLTIASIVGREFTLAQLQPLAEDLPRLRLLEVLEEALAARIIEELPRSAGRYQFTHALIQETLVEELSTTRRVQMHAQIAEALEGLYGAEAEAHAAELAHHFGEAVTVSGPAKLVQYSLVAGERALGSHAFEEALGYFQQGLSAKEGSGPAQTGAAADAETAALLFGLGRAQIATFQLHQIPEAVTTMRRAFDYYEQAGDLERAVAVAENPPPIMSGVVSGAIDLITRGLSLVPPDSPESVRLLSLQGRLLGLEAGDYASALAALEHSLEIARRSGDPSLEMRVLVDAAEVEGYHGRFERALGRARRAVELVSQADDVRSQMLAHYWVVLTLSIMGDPVGATPHATAALAAAERLRHHFYTARALFANAWLASLRGQWRVAHEYYDRGLAISPREARLLFQLAAVEYELGEFDEGESYLGRLLEVVKLTPPGPTLAHATYVAAVGTAILISGSPTAVAVAQEVASMVLSAPTATPINLLWAHQGLALIAVVQSDPLAAREHYDFLLGAGEEALLVIALVANERHSLMGLLACTLREWERAAGHFEDSLAFCRKAGYRPALAWTCVDYAHMLLEQERSGGDGGDGRDRAKATGLLDEGLQIARELGMKPLVERALRDKELLSA